MAHPIFSIPEILRLIVERIVAIDLRIRRLLFVSRCFFVCVVPFIWERIDSPRKLFKLVFPNVKPNQIDSAWINVSRFAQRIRVVY